MMKAIGIDATPLIGNRAGVGQYTGRLVGALIEEYPDWRYWLLSNRPLNGLEPELSGARSVTARCGSSRWLWMQFVLPFITGRLPIDLCHYTNATAPLWSPKPFVLSIHDASLFVHSDLHPRTRLLAMRAMLPSVARRARAIITMSHHAKNDLLRVLDVPSEKIRVIYEAAPENFKPIDDECVRNGIRKKYSLPEQYILYVGTIEPRKNLDRLLKAYYQLKHRGVTEKLVFAGQWGWYTNGFRETMERLGLQDDLQFLGYVPNQDLPAIYSMATLFVFPSLYEGFGLPPLEAMACGAPVVAGNNSSVAEICDSAAFLVDPFSFEELAEGMHLLLSDEDRRNTLRARGLARAREFTWARTARETAKVYEMGLIGSHG